MPSPAAKSLSKKKKRGEKEKKQSKKRSGKEKSKRRVSTKQSKVSIRAPSQTNELRSTSKGFSRKAKKPRIRRTSFEYRNPADIEDYEASKAKQGEEKKPQSPSVAKAVEQEPKQAEMVKEDSKPQSPPTFPKKKLPVLEMGWDSTLESTSGRTNDSLQDIYVFLRSISEKLNVEPKIAAEQTPKLPVQSSMEYLVYYKMGPLYIRPMGIFNGVMQNVFLAIIPYILRRSNGELGWLNFVPTDSTMTADYNYILDNNLSSKTLVNICIVALGTSEVKIYGEMFRGFSFARPSVIELKGHLFLGRMNPEGSIVERPVRSNCILEVNSGSLVVFICDFADIVLLPDWECQLCLKFLSDEPDENEVLTTIDINEQHIRERTKNASDSLANLLNIIEKQRTLSFEAKRRTRSPLPQARNLVPPSDVPWVIAKKRIARLSAKNIFKAPRQSPSGSLHSFKTPPLPQKELDFSMGLGKEQQILTKIKLITQEKQSEISEETPPKIKSPSENMKVKSSSYDTGSPFAFNSNKDQQVLKKVSIFKAKSANDKSLPTEAIPPPQPVESLKSSKLISFPLPPSENKRSKSKCSRTSIKKKHSLKKSKKSPIWKTKPFSGKMINLISPTMKDEQCKSIKAGYSQNLRNYLVDKIKRDSKTSIQLNIKSLKSRPGSPFKIKSPGKEGKNLEKPDSAKHQNAMGYLEIKIPIISKKQCYLKKQTKDLELEYSNAQAARNQIATQFNIRVRENFQDEGYEPKVTVSVREKAPKADDGNMAIDISPLKKSPLAITIKSVKMASIGLDFGSPTELSKSPLTISASPDQCIQPDSKNNNVTSIRSTLKLLMSVNKMIMDTNNLLEEVEIFSKQSDEQKQEEISARIKTIQTYIDQLMQDGNKISELKIDDVQSDELPVLESLRKDLYSQVIQLCNIPIEQTSKSNMAPLEKVRSVATQMSSILQNISKLVSSLTVIKIVIPKQLLKK